MSEGQARVADELTVVILTHDEEANITRTLDALAWATDVLLVDSGSADGTFDIAARYPQVRVVHRPFDTFAGQCNFALAKATGRWILSLDADYEISSELRDEIIALRESELAGWRARFVYRIHGRPLRGSLYPPRFVLYRRELASYSDEGHGHRVRVDGTIGELTGVIYHDDRKPLSRWFAAQARYAQAEAAHLLSADRRSLKVADRVRLMCWPAPVLVLLHVLLVKGCLFDGRSGWFYAMQRAFAEVALLVALLDRRLRKADCEPC
jgi:glycosyltransferase involved in cell wall biosynthesis